MSDDGLAAPPRPSIPPLCWVAVGLWLGTLLAEQRWWSAWRTGGSGSLVRDTVLAAMFGAALSFLLRRHGGAAVLVVSLCAGLIGGSLFWVWWGAEASRLADAGSRRWDAEALTDPREGRFSERSEVQLLTPHGGARVSVAWPEGQAPEAGRHVQFFGVMKKPTTDEFGRRSHQSGVCASVSARSVRDLGWTRSLRGFVGPLRARALTAAHRVPGAGGDLLEGVVLGDRRRMSGTQAESDFRTTGLTHLVAVSGSHLVVVAALIAWLLGALGVARVPTLTVVVGCVGLYVVATGVQPSAVRAWAMAVAGAGAGLSGRRSDSLAGVGAAGFIAIAVWPPVAFDLGFQLSVLAVVGLVMFARLTARWTEVALPSWGALLASPLALTLTAQATTMALTVSTFGAFSMIAPAANLLAGPLVSGVLVVGLAGVVLAQVWRGAGSWLLMASGALGEITVDIATSLAAVPYASIPLGSVSVWVVGGLLLGFAGLWAWWPAPRVAVARSVAAVAALVSIATALGPPAPAGMSVTVLDVGQGDAILVRDGPHALLVDTGPDAMALRTALARNRVRRLEAVAFSHAHEDHTGGTDALVRTIPVGRVYAARGAARELQHGARKLGTSVTEVEAGSHLVVGRIRVDVIAPPGEVHDPSENNSSLVLLVRAGSFSALLTGDAEAEVLDSLVGSGALGDVDVLKVGHHGSAAAVSPHGLAVVRPEVALISVGDGNRFGHPVPSTVSLLESTGSRVLRTDRSGDLAVRVGDDGSWRLAVGGRSTAVVPYATLWSVCSLLHDAILKGADEYYDLRPQAGLPDHQRAGVPASARAGQAQDARLRGCGHRLQLRGLRGRYRICGRDPHGLQHPAVRLRSPPGSSA